MPRTLDPDQTPDVQPPRQARADATATFDVWSVEGVFQQLVYSPGGAIEGLLIDTDGIATQFVVDPQDAPTSGLLAVLAPGRTLVLEGVDAGPSKKGGSPHTVYTLERLVSVDGRPPEAAPPHASVSGTVVRLNHARHGAPNGVLLDGGDFVHTRPDGFEQLGLKVGDTLEAEGPARPLATGGGRVIEAHRANGHALAPRR